METTKINRVQVRGTEDATRDSRFMVVIVGITMASLGVTLYPQTNRPQRDLMAVSACVMAAGLALAWYQVCDAGERFVVELFACVCAFHVVVVLFPVMYLMLGSTQAEVEADAAARQVRPSKSYDLLDCVAIAVIQCALFSPAAAVYWLVKLLLLKPS
jgi:hypothetical protein